MTGLIAQAIARSGDAYIGGAWVPASGAERLPVINPANGALVAEIVAGTSADLDHAVAAARAAFPVFAASPVAERLALLERIHALILERAEPLAQVLTLEMGAAITHARAAHVPFAAAHVQAAIEVLRDYAFLTMRGTTAIVREPIGVAGLITPWNWPLYQITAKVAPALAAGCTVVLKPSELSPLSALMFAQLVHDAGAPAGVFNLVNGTGSEVGACMAAHPDIDMISITGSNRAGVLVAQGAAPTVKRVTQELGGKSPNVLLPDADFARVVPLGVMAAFRNVGQSCSAPTRMIVPRARLAQVEALARETVESIVVGDPTQESTTLGPIANQAQFQRVQTMIAVGIEEGAKLVCGGLRCREQHTDGLYAHPTVFSEVSSAMRIAQEEIFGPVLVIIPYDDIDEAVAIANDTVFGLGGHVQGTDLAQARSVALRIRTGQVHINHPAWDAHAPFGGYRRSGNGREYGAFGFEEYLEIKAVLGFA
ncbi:MAG: aldehyde dehydrogenase family protein [Novosphingobium sp. 17-62-8]|nr:MAG: aldehyde dehydrogenase family protein [Novosphingobium sp. 17-62-8]HQS69838.1 aldehyde dehydrogenase family protein [Novosphingobium sp.]